MISASLLSNNKNNEKQHQQPPFFALASMSMYYEPLARTTPQQKSHRPLYRHPPLFSCPQIKRIKRICIRPLYFKLRIIPITLMASTSLLSNNKNNEKQHQQPPFFAPASMSMYYEPLARTTSQHKSHCPLYRHPPLFSCPQIKRIKQIASASIYFKLRIILITLMASALLSIREPSFFQRRI